MKEGDNFQKYFKFKFYWQTYTINKNFKNKY